MLGWIIDKLCNKLCGKSTLPYDLELRSEQLKAEAYLIHMQAKLNKIRTEMAESKTQKTEKLSYR